MLYLQHSDFQGNPIGVWNSAGESFYEDDYHPLKARGRAIMDNRFEEEGWEEFAERTAERISMRDWWVLHESDEIDLEKVFYEIKPSSAPFDI